MLSVDALVMMAIHRFLAVRSLGGSVSQVCVVCSKLASGLSQCCKTPLCPRHSAMFVADNNPCPCGAK
jgi:hypothetical protein